MDRFRAMAAFVAVADEEGFAAAGRALRLSAPSVTRLVSELEETLGARLFHRTTRSVRLTDAGGRYLEDCRRILTDLEEADAHAGGRHGQPEGWVSVTGSALFGRLALTPILFRLMDRYPALSVSTLFVDRLVHMMDEGIDVAVRIADLPDSTLVASRVGSVRRVLCAAPSYLEEQGTLASVADLDQHQLIDFSQSGSGSQWGLVSDGKTVTHRPDTRLRVNTADAAIAAAVAGRGVTCVLSYQVAAEVAEGTLQIVLPEAEGAPLPVHVVHKEAGQTSARVRAVVDHLVEELRVSSWLEH
ncbi:MAG: LysR family transcriptional regulator [Parvibaculum sp.]|jgi:DNA-binding transcriptional LysR family regulator|nr:LysR family transcriptional regulator [Parvibaculum sp.]|tara:strand:- start:738 stop:1640 length:903 start_codon:yes stop_codon:yes gene_type:complete